MQKITKAAARRLFLAGYPVWVWSSKMLPNVFRTPNMAIKMQLTKDSDTDSTTLPSGKVLDVFAKNLNNFRHHNCTKETVRVSFYINYTTPKPLINFVGDNCQYIQHFTRDGYFGPFVGAGSDEADAYRDAVEHAFGCDTRQAAILPKRFGSKRRGMAHYFGRETAREHAKFEGSDLYIYCIIYLPKI